MNHHEQIEQNNKIMINYLREEFSYPNKHDIRTIAENEGIHEAAYHIYKYAISLNIDTAKIDCVSIVKKCFYNNI